MKLLLALAFFAIALNLAAADYYTADGTGNNIKHPLWGASETFQLRYAKSNFPADGDLLTPNQRSISNLVSDERTPTANDNNVNMFESLFGQFINHDKEFTRNLDPLVSNIIVPVFPGDLLYNPSNPVVGLIVSRSPEITGKLKKGPVEIQNVNHATSFFDLSQLYGNNQTQVDLMRSHIGGRLKTSDYTIQLAPPPVPAFTLTNMLPSQLITGLPVQTALTVPTQILTAGDIRVNENIGLALITTIWMREHNRNADALAAANPSWTDDQLFTEARKLTVATYQRIIYEEYIPAIMTPEVAAASEYLGYKKNIDPGTSLEFAIGAFRYGHSTIDNWELRNSTNCPAFLTVPASIFGGPPGTFVSTAKLPSAGQLGGPFTAPLAFASAGIGNILRGLLRNKVNKADILVADALRNIRFAGATGLGVDLMTDDLSRGRMLGLASYHNIRKQFFNGPGVPRGFGNVYDAPGCTTDDDDEGDGSYDDSQSDRRRQTISDPIECFLQITSDAVLAEKIRSIYGKVSKVEAMVGLLAEDHLPGAYLPRTLSNVIMAEYKRSREGDRFYYENDGVLTTSQMAFVQSRAFASVVRDAFPGVDISNDIFHVPSGLPTCSP